MKTEDLKIRINQIIELSNRVSATGQSGEFGSWVNDELFREFRSASLSFLKNTFGESHPFYKEFDNSCSGAEPTSVYEGRGILKAVKSELDGGWIFRVKDLISAEIFSDFLEMSEYLLNENYKDASAVMIGSVLEEHLRQLCNKNGIEVETIKGGRQIFKKADLLNADLCKAEVYNKLDQKSITSWLDLRNKSAHGKYEEYTIEQVRIMYQGVLNFISRTT